jgi:hypothetical protein
VPPFWDNFYRREQGGLCSVEESLSCPQRKSNINTVMNTPELDPTIRDVAEAFRFQIHEDSITGTLF